MKEMNSLTHSCIHSLASFAILAFSGRAVFMIRATGAKLRMLASESSFLSSEARPVVFGDGDEEAWDIIGRVTAMARPELKRLRSGLDDWPIVGHARVIDAMRSWKRCQSQRASICVGGYSLCAQIRKKVAEKGRLTICYWKPSVLLFDFEFVGQSSVWVLRIVHLRIWVVRRLYILFNVFLWRGSRHD